MCVINLPSEAGYLFSKALQLNAYPRTVAKSAGLHLMLCYQGLGKPRYAGAIVGDICDIKARFCTDVKS